MGKILAITTFLGCGLAVGAWGQIKKQFTVETPEECASVDLHLKAKTGNCFVRPSQNDDILNIYSNQDIEEYSHSFKQEVRDGICYLKLSLEQEGDKGVGTMISSQVFGSEENVSDKIWKVYLTDSRPYNLDLSYGLGNANVDLSGLAISKLKINTGSADVNVSYSSGLENKVEMDTFFVKVDVGSLNVRQLHLSRSRLILADVGFGTMMLDFSSKPVVNNHVVGSVGAGSLVILLPSAEIPVMVKINESWLCSVSLSRSLQKIGDNTFANAAYTDNPKDALTFDLDVSLGNITFKEK
jgi:hypothetical protein